MFDIKEAQIHTDEQRVVLSTLAESAARPGCRFLEVGSWCGDSTLLLGKIAQEAGGRLYCVDWWKGNVGTELIEIAEKKDVFFYFWNRVCREGLEDVVVPIRSRSDLAAGILREQAFDLVFIDADHRYEPTVNDIKGFAPLVRGDGGVLCGHDCEGRISDYDAAFLESGKKEDIYESIHCGVVLAVGEAFKDYSLNHAIWSLRSDGGGGWESTGFEYPGIKDKRQTPPPEIGVSKNYSFLRYGRQVYGVPCFLLGLDVTEEKETERDEIIKANGLKEVEKIIGERIYAPQVPLGYYKGFTFLDFDGRIYAFRTALGPLDLIRTDKDTVEAYFQSGDCLVGNSIDEVRLLLGEEAEITEPEGDLSGIDRRIYTLQSENETLKEGIEAVKSENEAVKKENESLKAELAARDERIEVLQNEITKIRATLLYRLRKYFKRDDK